MQQQQQLFFWVNKSTTHESDSRIIVDVQVYSKCIPDEDGIAVPHTDMQRMYTYKLINGYLWSACWGERGVHVVVRIWRICLWKKKRNTVTTYCAGLTRCLLQDTQVTRAKLMNKLSNFLVFQKMCTGYVLLSICLCGYIFMLYIDFCDGCVLRRAVTEPSNKLLLLCAKFLFFN